MKPKFIHTRGLLTLLICCTVCLAGCKKTESAPPDLAAQVLGAYKVTAIGNLPNNLPAVPTAASVTVARNGSDLDKVLITAAYSLTSSAGSQAIVDTKTISLQQSGSNVDLYDGSSKVGYWNNNSIFAADYPFLTAKISFTATK
jgi:hypothetical protein